MVAVVTGNVISLLGKSDPGAAAAEAATADGKQNVDFAEVLDGIFGSDATPQVASVLDGTVLTTKQAGDQPDKIATDQTEVAADLLALFGLPTVAPPAALVPVVTDSLVQAGVTSIGSGNTTPAQAANVDQQPIPILQAATLNQPLKTAQPLPGATPATTQADDATSVPVAPTLIPTSSTSTSAATDNAANNTTNIDRQWLQSMTNALRAKAAPSDAPTIAKPKLVTAASLEITSVDNRIAPNPTDDIASTHSLFQVVLDSAASTVAMAVPLRDLRRSEGSADSAPATPTNAAVGNASAQLQPAGTLLASDANKLDQQAAVKLHAAVGSHQWATELGNKLTMMASKDTQSATLYMTPADLGPVQVRIDMNQSQASVWFTAEHPDTRSALEQSLPRLREMFTAQGMSLTDAGVFGNRSSQQQAQSHPGNNQFTQPHWSGEDALQDTSAIRSISLSMLDAYA